MSNLNPYNPVNKKIRYQDINNILNKLDKSILLKHSLYLLNKTFLIIYYLKTVVSFEIIELISLNY